MEQKSRGTLGDLLARQGVPVSDAAAPPAASVPASPPPGLPDLGRSAKIVLRRERKGRGGKTTTVVAGLNLDAADLERLVRTLRRALGCGATVDGDRLVLQGDLTTRLASWLREHGARRVVV